MNEELKNRQKGCFFGLAIGDALGTPIEKKIAGTFPVVIGYKDGKRGSKAGEWTDDTSMALALADSLSNGHSMKDQLDKYVEWYKNGKYTTTGKCKGMGGTTRQSLEDYIKNSQLESSLIETRGNGSIMRLAPVCIKHSFDRELSRIAIESSATTHNSPVCKSACEYMSIVLGGLIRGLSKEIVLDKNWEHTIDMQLESSIRAIADGNFLTEKVDGDFNVVSGLQSALWAFAVGDSFEDVVLKAVNLGNDADTTAAIAGQFAGAFYGYNSIPERFIEGLAGKEMIEEYLNKLIEQDVS